MESTRKKRYIEREGDEKRLEEGAAGAAATAAVLVRGQILSTCCTMLDVGRMDVGEQNPSSSLPPHPSVTQWEDTSTSFVSICGVRLSLSIHS